MNEELINDKLQLSKLYFKSNDFQRALKTYNEILQLINDYSPEDLQQINQLYNIKHSLSIFHPKITSVIDQRSATFEKLGDLSSALKDGEKIIAINPLEIKGYLRLGKIYKLTQNHVKCFKIYQRGIYTIKQFRTKYPDWEYNQQLWHKLVKNYNEINALLKAKTYATDINGGSGSHNVRPASSSDLERFSMVRPVKRQRKNLDPFNYLSFDVMEIIFSHIPHIYNYHQVNKTWWYNLKSLNMYRTIQLRSKINIKQFTQGVNFFKSLKKIDLVINPTNDGDFYRILESIILNKLIITKLEILKTVKFNQVLHKFDKLNFNFPFKNIQTFKCFINDGNHLIVDLLPNLRHLELYITNQSDERIVIKNKQVINKLKSNGAPPLETLILTSLDHISPPLLSYTFNLTKLVLVNFNFTNIQHKLGIFLSHCDNLTSLYLENNIGLSFKLFMNNLINYKPNFKLSQLVFREYSIEDVTNLSNFELADFENLKYLDHLDLYQTSISNTGLLKLLSITTSIQCLILGSSNYIIFHNDYITNHSKLLVSQLLTKCPKLVKISLIDLNLDNSSCNLINQDLTRFMANNKSRLNVELELSFNNNINGIGLFNLFNNLNILKRLIIDGVLINKDSLMMLESKYGIIIKNDALMTKWRRFGINSYILDH